jgi:predicted DNA binding CopG/RHH family protein
MKTKQVNIRLSEEDKKKLAYFVLENETSIQEVLEKYIKDLIRETK